MAQDAADAQRYFPVGLTLSVQHHPGIFSRPKHVKIGKSPMNKKSMRPGMKYSGKGVPFSFSTVHSSRRPSGAKKSIAPLMRAPTPIRNMRIRRSRTGNGSFFFRLIIPKPLGETYYCPW
jgi:hypothetical protein